MLVSRTARPAIVIESERPIMTYRFVHTADIHLDSPLRSLAMRDALLADKISTASRDSFSNIVSLCISENVDALLIAGDLYDGSQTSMKTARFLTSQLERLEKHGIRVFIILGNHDAESRLTRQLILPGNVHIFPASAGMESFNHGDMKICIHGISFEEPHVSENLLYEFASAVSGAINIGMLHTSLGGSEGHDPYSPCTLNELMETGFNYWALGHIHKRSEHKGATTVVMPGIPQGRDIGEEGTKSVTLVSIDNHGNVSTEEHETSIVEFARIEIAIDGMEDWESLVGAIGSHIDDARARSDNRQLVLRLKLVGQTDLKWQVERDFDLLLNECIHAAERHDGVWIDKLESGITFPEDHNETVASDSTLSRLFHVSGDDLEISDDAHAYMDKFITTLPAHVRNMFGTKEESGRIRQELMNEGVNTVIARLQQSMAGDRT